MKKMHFVLFFVVGCAFLFLSCEVTEKPDTTISRLVGIAKSDNGSLWRVGGGGLVGLPFDQYILDSISTKIVITDTAMLNEYFADTYSVSLNEA